MKKHILKFASAIMLLVMITTIITLAVTQYPLLEVHRYTSYIETFTVNNETTYYDQQTLSIPANSTQQIDIVVHNSGNTTQFFDLVVVSEEEVTLKLNVTETYTFTKAIVYQSPTETAVNGSQTFTLTVTNNTDALIDTAIYYAALKNNYQDNQSLNYYVTSEYQLHKILNSEVLNDIEEYYRKTPTIIFIDDVIISEDLIINIPANLQLLCNNVTLNAKLDINHHYHGIYYIDGIGGQIINDSFPLTINAYNSYYYKSSLITDNLGFFVSNESNFIDNSNTDFANNPEYLDALFKEVETYLTKAIPDATIYDLVLPQQYLNYGIEISYQVEGVTSNLSSTGTVTRAEETTETTLGITISFGSKTSAFTKQVKVIGSSDIAIASYAKDVLQTYLNESLIYDGNYLGWYLGYRTQLINQVFDTYTYNYINVTNSSGGSYQYVTLSNVDNNYYLTKDVYVYTADTIQLNYEILGISDFVEVSVAGLNDKEKVDLIKSAYSNIVLEFVNESTSVQLININDVSVRNFGLEDIEYKIYLVDIDYDTTSNIPPTDFEDYTSKFLLNSDKLLSIDYTQTITVPDGKKLVLEVNPKFLHPTLDNPGYIFYEDIIFPENGLGGSSGAVVIENILTNLFDTYSYTLESFYTNAKTFGGLDYSLRIVNSGIDSFVQIITTSTNYLIQITPENVPKENTLVQVECTFTTNYEDVTQNYYFTIPGIYQEGTDISSDLFPAFLYYFNKEYAHDFGLTSHVLVDEVADSTIESLDLSANFLSSIAITNNPLDIKGINIPNIQEVILDDNNILSLEPFINSSYQTISLKNCQLTTTDIDDDLIYLHSVNTIKSLYLDNNNITRLTFNNNGSQTSYFYRSITLLSLNNNNLESVEGIGAVSNLETLYLEHNQIKDFSPLLNLVDTLKTVYLGKNIVSDDASTTIDESKYFGSCEADDGTIYNQDNTTTSSTYYPCINIVYYYLLIDNNVNVYLLDSSLTPVQVTTDNDLMVVANVLSSIEGFEEHYGSAYLPSVLVYGTTGERIIEVVSSSTTYTQTNNLYQFSATADIEVIITTTINNITLSRYYIISYRG